MTINSIVMSYITTFTGKHFDPIHPVPEKIDMKDIAHALSLICRANGHTVSFILLPNILSRAAKRLKHEDFPTIYSWDVCCMTAVKLICQM